LPTGRKSDGLHDEPVITMNIMATDPEAVRHSARVKAGLATIDGVSVADLEKTLAISRAIVDYRATVTVDAIRKALGR